jgi:hypothetical protein
VTCEPSRNDGAWTHSDRADACPEAIKRSRIEDVAVSLNAALVACMGMMPQAARFTMPGEGLRTRARRTLTLEVARCYDAD